MSVCHSVHGRRVSCDHYQWCIAPQRTGAQTHALIMPQPQPSPRPWDCTGYPPGLAPYFWTWDPTVQGPPLSSAPYQWHLVTNTGNLFKLVHLREPPLPYWCWHLVATEGPLVGKWAEHIVMECFLFVSNAIELSCELANGIHCPVHCNILKVTV